MDIKLKLHQQISAILHLVMQNNIQLKVLTECFIEYVAEKDGNDMANKFEGIINASFVETQDATIAHLKRMFGDVDDINLNDLTNDK